MQVAQNVPTIVLKKKQNTFFFQINVFFRCGVKKNLKKNKSLDIFDSHSKYATWNIIFIEKLLEKQNKINK